MLDAKGPASRRFGLGFKNARFEMAFERKTVGVGESSLWIVGNGGSSHLSGY